jgi:hypothetical protein
LTNTAVSCEGDPGVTIIGLAVKFVIIEFPVAVAAVIDATGVALSPPPHPRKPRIPNGRKRRFRLNVNMTASVFCLVDDWLSLGGLVSHLQREHPTARLVLH